MHPSSIENMRRIRRTCIDVQASWLVLDVGGRKHSYCDIFPEIEPARYRIADIAPGHGVTDLMPSPYSLPFGPNLFDLVVSGQMLEHCRNPFRSVKEMVRVLRPGGRIVLIAPSAGPRHDNVDCWRFMDDAFAAIAEEVGLLTIADWIQHDAADERSRKWADHCFVGEKPGSPT